MSARRPLLVAVLTLAVVGGGACNNGSTDDVGQSTAATALPAGTATIPAVAFTPAPITPTPAGESTPTPTATAARGVTATPTSTSEPPRPATTATPPPSATSAPAAPTPATSVNATPAATPTPVTAPTGVVLAGAWTVANGGAAGAPAYAECADDGTPVARLADGSYLVSAERGVDPCIGWARVRTEDGEEGWLQLRYISEPAPIEWRRPLDATWSVLVTMLDPEARACVDDNLHTGELEATTLYQIFAPAPAWAERLFDCAPVRLAVAVGIGSVRADAERYNVTLDAAAVACWLPYLSEIVARDRSALITQDGVAPEVVALTAEAVTTCSPHVPAAALASGFGIEAGSPRMQCIVDSPDEIRAALATGDPAAAALAAVELIYRCAPNAILDQVVAILNAQNRAPSPAGIECLRETDAAIALLRATASTDVGLLGDAQALVETCLAR